eukprot:1193179-Amphidinium_carterae.1
MTSTTWLILTNTVSRLYDTNAMNKGKGRGGRGQESEGKGSGRGRGRASSKPHPKVKSSPRRPPGLASPSARMFR